MLKITLKDESVLEVEEGKLIIEVAKGLSSSLAKKCCVAEFNGKLVDLKTPLTIDGKLDLVISELINEDQKRKLSSEEEIKL